MSIQNLLEELKRKAGTSGYPRVEKKIIQLFAELQCKIADYEIGDEFYTNDAEEEFQKYLERTGGGKSESWNHVAVDEVFKAGHLAGYASGFFQGSCGENPATTAILYALKDDNGMDFLRLWNEGEFDSLRENWENIPDGVFIGADPLFKPGEKDVN